ncbi:peptidase S8/S53 domain-containing protein [Scenedesmus sp. NREL 46B-D3]|nr:peptidase S8/S53 domain-containing protein [Scenedesmus sp. NREL 46B-D3]
MRLSRMDRTGSSSTSTSSTAAAAITRRRRLSATLASRASAGQAAAAGPSAHLAGHWHTSSSFRPSQYDIWGNSIGDQQCASKDTQLADAAGAEVLPWGIKAIGAANETLLKAQPKGRAIVCIIDSGLARDHLEYRSFPGQLSGCQAGASCPYDWSKDVVGHGTHVAGTIGAARNGVGVIGVMPSGADMHVVRIWDVSGDVSQGQGPYATDLVLAYDNCLSHLIEQQKTDKSAKMVISMSYGSAGPLTVERLWITRAARRGDVLFVASAGNNGTYLTPAGPSKSEQQLADLGQFKSYPASYDLAELLSVANMRCDGTIDFSSQKNNAVSIAAPGMAILSSVPRAYGAVRAYITTSRALPPQTKPVERQVYSNGVDEWEADASSPTAGSSRSSASPSQTSRLPRLEVRSGLGYLPNGYKEPRAVQGTRLGSSGMVRIAACDVAADIKATAFYRPPQQQALQPPVQPCAGAKGAVCVVQLPGIIDWYHETCVAMLRCAKGGGKGLILWRNDTVASGFAGGDSEFSSLYEGYDVDEYLLGTQVNCGTRCACWADLRQQLGCSGGDCSSRTPPGIVVSAAHAQALERANATSPELRVNITTYEYNFRHYDGTSMAAPHVAGAAALLWRLFPACKAADISQAIKQSAQKLPDQPQLAAGAGLLQVDQAFDWLKKNKACAGS